MPVNKTKKSDPHSRTSAVQAKPEKKAPGTRYGTLEDWRGSNGKQKSVVRRNALRDGR